MRGKKKMRPSSALNIYLQLSGSCWQLMLWESRLWPSKKFSGVSKPLTVSRVWEEDSKLSSRETLRSSSISACVRSWWYSMQNSEHRTARSPHDGIEKTTSRNLVCRKGLKRRAESKQREPSSITQILKSIHKSVFMPMPWQFVALPCCFYSRRREMCVVLHAGF